VPLQVSPGLAPVPQVSIPGPGESSGWRLTRAPDHQRSLPPSARGPRGPRLPTRPRGRSDRTGRSSERLRHRQGDRCPRHHRRHRDSNSGPPDSRVAGEPGSLGKPAFLLGFLLFDSRVLTASCDSGLLPLWIPPPLQDLEGHLQYRLHRNPPRRHQRRQTLEPRRQGRALPRRHPTLLRRPGRRRPRRPGPGRQAPEFSPLLGKG
jgi:hypothetical protein